MDDYSRYKSNNKFYSGSEEKIGITINGNDYLVKLQKNTELGLIDNHYSEFLGSHIFQMLGFNTQETFLGLYKGREAVIIKDFTSREEQFVPFNDIGDSTLEENRERFQYSYEDIMEMLKQNRKLTSVEETISLFWEMFLVDALIGNFDRHGGNWGFLKKEGKYRLAPIFDNGSSFFPRLNSDNACKEILENKEEIEKRTFSFPTSQIRLGNRKSSYFDVIDSLKFAECNKALKKLYQLIDLDQIYLFIDSIAFWSETRKAFYKTMVKARFEGLWKGPYKRLCLSTN